MLQDNFKYYIANQDELVKQYNGKHLVLANCSVVAAEDSREAAYSVGKARFGLGNFILQKCSPGDKDYTLTFHTHRVHFDQQQVAEKSTRIVV